MIYKLKIEVSFVKETKNEEIKNENNEIEIVIGDDSNLEISDVGDCMNDLRPKDRDKKKKGIVIPKIKKK